MDFEYIITRSDDDAIWGYGQTEADAWDMLHEERDDEWRDDEFEDMVAKRASLALLAEADAAQGNRSWL